jgi:hypothetical protein
MECVAMVITGLFLRSISSKIRIFVKRRLDVKSGKYLLENTHIYPPCLVDSPRLRCAGRPSLLLRRKEGGEIFF